jgi:ligand-binding sensor domain-containing protein/signal transduction histidine kinase
MFRGCSVLLLSALLTYAELLPIRAYNTSDGLAQDRVNAIAADSRGFLWFAATGGLSQFDGYRFTTWEGSKARAFAVPYTMIAAPGGEYWLGTRNGVVRFGKEGPEHGKTFVPDTPSHTIIAMLRTRSGRIFAATGFGLYEVAAERMRRIPLAIEADKGVRIGFLAEDQAGRIWVSAPPFIHVLQTGSEGESFASQIELPPNVTNVTSLVQTRPDRVWLGSNAGLLLYEQRAGAGSWVLRHAYGVRDGLAGRSVNALLRASDNVIWAGTTGGISRFTAGEDPPHFSNLKARLLTDIAISALAEDRTGNIWAGTESAGAMRIRPHGFTTFQEDDGLKSPGLLQVLEDRDGTVMGLGQTANEARILTFFQRGRFEQGIPEALAARGSWGWQSILIRSRAGPWWAATSGGLCRFPSVPAAALLRSVPDACYTSEKIFRVFEDSRGNIWASSQDNYLLRWNRDTGKVVYVAPDGTPSALRTMFGGLVSAMAEDRAGNVWLGFWTGGLVRWSQGGMATFRKDETAPAGSILTLYTDSQGRLWVGADLSGLSVFDDPASPAPRFTPRDTSNGASTDSVRTIVEDRFGNIWAGTPRGIVRLDPRTGGLRRFSSADGLPQAVLRSSLRDAAGNLWFATSRGLARIVPAPDEQSAPPAVLLTGIQVADEEHPISLFGESRVAGIELSPSNRHVRIEFAAPGSASAEDVRYQFMLAGADTAWSNPRPEHTVEYRNLDAGSYRFSVRSVGAAGAASSAAEFDFRVLPPVWLRWWFELGVALAAAGVGWWLHRVRLAHWLAVERMRTGIATDLHDEIGAGLARIAIVSEVARVNRTEAAASAPLVKIATIARELLDSLNDIVWTVRSSDSSAESLVSRMREFGLDVLSERETGFVLVCDREFLSRQLDPHTRREILLIFKECIHNIAKHSGCRSARAELKAGEGSLILCVSDDGHGPRNGVPGNGIPGMVRRAHAMGGQIEYGRGASGGFTVTLRIPDPSRRAAYAFR